MLLACTHQSRKVTAEDGLFLGVPFSIDNDNFSTTTERGYAKSL